MSHVIIWRLSEWTYLFLELVCLMIQVCNLFIIEKNFCYIMYEKLNLLSNVMIKLIMFQSFYLPQLCICVYKCMTCIRFLYMYKHVHLQVHKWVFVSYYFRVTVSLLIMSMLMNILTWIIYPIYICTQTYLYKNKEQRAKTI